LQAKTTIRGWNSLIENAQRLEFEGHHEHPLYAKDDSAGSNAARTMALTCSSVK
jgi:hypothetical protein